MKQAIIRIEYQQRQRILLAPLFLISVAILVLNDLWLKGEFHNFLTGKLSDVAGLFAFPLFFSAALLQRRRLVYILTAIGFVFWKTPLSSNVIGFWNSFGLLQVGRTVDYGDLIALAVLPLSYLYLGVALQRSDSCGPRLKRFLTGASVAFSLFAFTATTLVKDRTVSLFTVYSIPRAHLSNPESALRENPSVVQVQAEQNPESWRKDLEFNSNADATTNKNKGRRRGVEPTPLPSALPAVYWFDVEIAERTCDSERSRFRFMVERKDANWEISGVNLSFECRAYEKTENTNALNKTYIAHARQIFEGHVVNHLMNYRSE